MSRCDDDDPLGPDGPLASDDPLAPATPELLAEAIAHATDFLFDACHSNATCITRGLTGEHGAIFILKDADDVDAFMRLYIEKFHATIVERVDMVARARAGGARAGGARGGAQAGDGPIICNVPPDFESN